MRLAEFHVHKAQWQIWRQDHWGSRNLLREQKRKEDLQVIGWQMGVLTGGRKLEKKEEQQMLEGGSDFQGQEHLTLVVSVQEQGLHG